MEAIVLDAIKDLQDGHAMYTVARAREILEALGVLGGVPETLITRWTGQDDANPNNEPKGLTLKNDEPGEGVSSLALGYYIVGRFALKTNAGAFFGRGRQAFANASAIAVYINEQEQREENGGFTRREIHDAEVSDNAGS